MSYLCEGEADCQSGRAKGSPPREIGGVVVGDVEAF